MTLLDQNIPDASTVSVRPVSVRYGLIWGGISIAISLISFLLGVDPAMPDTGTAAKMIIGLIGFAVPAWAVFAAIKQHRDQELGGYLSLGRGIGVGTLSGLVAGVISAIWIVLYVMVINPGFTASLQEAQTAQMESQGMSEEQIEMAVSMAGWFTNPGFLAFSQLFGGVITGFILGLIIGAIMKREPTGA
jgi:hypothetical protein